MNLQQVTKGYEGTPGIEFQYMFKMKHEKAPSICWQEISIDTSIMHVISHTVSVINWRLMLVCTHHYHNYLMCK